MGQAFSQAFKLSAEKIVAALVLAEDGQEIILRDTEIKGLVLWKRTGAQALPRWYLFRKVKGRKVKVRLSDASPSWPTTKLPRARELAQELLAELARGANPVDERQAQRQAEAAERAEKAREKREGPPVLVDPRLVLKRMLSKVKKSSSNPRHADEIERVIERFLSETELRDLAAPGCGSVAEDWLESLELAPMTVNRYRRHIIGLGRQAVRWFPADVLGREPFLALQGLGAQSPPPRYFCPWEAALLVSEEAMESEIGRLVALLLYSGARYREMAFARWDRLDADAATYEVIPPNEEERKQGFRVKRDKPRTIYLQSEICSLLSTWAKRDKGEGEDRQFLFSGQWRQAVDKKITKYYRQHLEAVGIPLEGEDGRPRCIHSLRHTSNIIALACGEGEVQGRLSRGWAGPEMQTHYGKIAMRFKGLLRLWRGEWRLRDPAEVARISQGWAVKVGQSEAAGA